MVCFSILSCSFFNTGIDITSCRYSYSIIIYIKRANVKSYIAIVFGQLNINIAGGCAAAAILTCFTAYAVCSKINTAAFTGRAVRTISSAFRSAF